MSEHMSDKEQVQLVKDWWKQYGGYILTVVIVFLASNYGWRYWHSYQDQRANLASTTYIQMQNMQSLNKQAEAQLFAEKLNKDYKNTSYSSLAALTSAKDAVNNGKLDVAEKKLQFALEQSKDKSFRQIARLRLARVLLSENQPQKVLTLLDVVDEPNFAAAIAEIKGDALLAMGKKSEALQSYQDANSALNASGVDAPLLKVKLEQLSGSK
jgi:predicted negative regulator of RcsB-dependent stress response